MDCPPTCAARTGLRLRRSASWCRQAAALLLAMALPQAASAQVPSPVPAESIGAAAVAPAAVGPAGSTPPGAAAAGAAAGPIPVPAISRLPAGMTAAVEAQGRVLQLQVRNPVSGQPVTVAQLPLRSPTFETLHIGGFLYVACGDAPIVVLDVRELLHPRTIASFSPGGPAVSLWGGAGSLIIYRADGSTLLVDVNDPEHPRYQGVMANPHAVAEPEYSVPVPPPQPAQSRLAVSLRPFLFFANGQRSPTSSGTLVDFSYQYARQSGLWWGIELAPFQLSSYYDGLPSFNSRVWFGYSWRSFALAVATGTGWNNDSTFFQIGPGFRFGRLDRVHSTLRIMFSAFAPLVYPSSSEFTLEGPINRRVGLRYNFTQDSALNGFYTALGLQVFLGGDRRWRTTVLTPGLGFAFMRTSSLTGFSSRNYTNHPGVIFTLSIEPRW